MVKRSILVTTALVLTCSGINAADQIYAEPAAAADWSGVYLGLQGGYAFGNADHSFSPGAPSGSSDPDGFVGGVHAGYNAQYGAYVIGMEADIEAGSVDGSYTNLTGATSVGAVELNWQGSVRARIGYAMQNYLLYATAGWAIGDFDIGGGPAPLPVSGGYSDTRHGWTVGAGAEAMLTQNWLARVEYRYTDFGTASGTLAPGFPGVTMPVDLQTHAIHLGVSYKF